MDIRCPETRPRRILTQVKIETYILEAEKVLTLMGNAHPTDTKWRSRTIQRHDAFQAMATTSQLRD